MRPSATHSLSLHTAVEVTTDITKGIWHALLEIGAARLKVRKVQALWAMSDKELAARDLRRADIVRLVMAGVI